MSDAEEKPKVVEAEAFPPMTNGDLETVIQFLAGLTIMGMVRAVFHPCRFPTLYTAMLQHGAITNPEDLPESMAEVNIPIVLESPVNGEPITCDVVQWAACPTPDCEGCASILAQGANYPVPPEEKPEIWTPN